MSKEIKDNFDDVKVELIEGSKGEFMVGYFEDPPGLLFSSNECNKFPKYGEISSMLVEKYGCENRKIKRGL